MRKSAHMASRPSVRAFNNAMTPGNTLPAPSNQATTNKLAVRSFDSNAMRPYWKKVDDVSGGIETMKTAGKDYLPSYPGESNEAYLFRLSLAKLTNIYGDTVSSISAKPFEQEISFPVGENAKLPDQIASFIENVDGAGNNITKFAAGVFYNGVNYTHDWIMVNFPRIQQVEGKVRTLADDKAEGIRPFWSRVPASNVYEVRTAIVGGNEILTYVRIFEPSVNQSKERYREFELIGGQVQLTIWEQNPDGTDFVQVEDTPYMMTINQIPMVPFITGEREGRRWFFDPPLRDALELQVVLYRKESGLEFAETMTAYPMLCMIGVKPEKNADGTNKELPVGPSRILWIPSDGAGNVGDAKYIEPSATSLTLLRETIKETKQDLRELGKQPLTAQSGNLTVITTAVAAGKTKSVVAAWGLSLKDALENALAVTCQYLKIAKDSYDPEVTVYDGYDDFEDTAADLSALQSARDKRDISQETYWSELKRRNVLSAEFDPEAEKKRLLKEIPADELTGEDDDDTKPDDKTKPKPQKETQL